MPAETELVLTVLAPELAPEEPPQVRQLLRELRVELAVHDYVETGAIAGCACHRWKIRTPGSLLDARNAVRQLDCPFDLIVHPLHTYAMQPKLLASDLDSTMIDIEVIDELAKLAGVGEKLTRITAAAMNGKLDFQQSFRQRVALLKGLREDALQPVVETISLTSGAERLIRSLHARGCKIAILSGSFSFAAKLLKRKLPIDFAYTNQLEIRDGYVTGQVIGEIVDGARKVALLREIAAAENISLDQVIAVGDGANDIPMLQAAGLGAAFHAKAKVREQVPISISRVGLDGILHLIDPSPR